LQKPDGAELAQIPFPSDVAVQPDWIRDRYPAYADPHGMEHELTSVRTADHNGHHIKITTTYQIEIDGHSVHLHALVGNDGRLFCHTTPYVQYQSAIDLVKALMDRFPAAFEDLEQASHHSSHSSHEPSQESRQELSQEASEHPHSDSSHHSHHHH
jgi:hypothetical protein